MDLFLAVEVRLESGEAQGAPNLAGWSLHQKYCLLRHLSAGGSTEPTQKSVSRFASFSLKDEQKSSTKHMQYPFFSVTPYYHGEGSINGDVNNMVPNRPMLTIPNPLQLAWFWHWSLPTVLNQGRYHLCRSSHAKKIQPVVFPCFSLIIESQIGSWSNPRPHRVKRLTLHIFTHTTPAQQCLLMLVRAQSIISHDILTTIRSTNPNPKCKGMINPSTFPCFLGPASTTPRHCYWRGTFRSMKAPPLMRKCSRRPRSMACSWANGTVAAGGWFCHQQQMWKKRDHRDAAPMGMGMVIQLYRVYHGKTPGMFIMRIHWPHWKHTMGDTYPTSISGQSFSCEKPLALCAHKGFFECFRFAFGATLFADGSRWEAKACSHTRRIMSGIGNVFAHRFFTHIVRPPEEEQRKREEKERTWKWKEEKKRRITGREKDK